MGELTVTIPASRYEELIAVEARVDATVSVAKANKYMSLYDMLRVLGFSDIAEGLENDEKAMRKQLIREGKS